MAHVTGGDPLNTTFRGRLAKFVHTVVDTFLAPPAPAQPQDPAAIARRGVTAAFNRLDEMRQQGGGAPPATVEGAGWVSQIDPVLRTDEEQQALWGSEGAKYGRFTTATGIVPQAYAAMRGTDITLERVAQLHFEVDRMGVLYNKADTDFQVNRKDAHIKASQRARVAHVYRTELQFAPASQTPLGLGICQFVRRVVSRVPNMCKAEEDLLQAAAHGYSGLECVYREPADLVVPISRKKSVTVREACGLASLEWVHPRDFRWNPIKRSFLLDAGGNRYIDPFHNPDGSPTYKLILHGADGAGDPPQRGYDFAALPLHLLKHQGVARWAVMLELFGIQTPYMQYEGDGWADNGDISQALDFLGYLGRGRPALLSRKFGEVKITPPAQGVDARGQHAAIAGFINSELSKLIQAQTLTMEIGGSGSYAAANVQADSKEEVQLIDARLASETWTHQLVVYIVEMNIDQLCAAFGATPEQVRAECPRAFRVVDRRVDPVARLGMFKMGKEIGLPIDDDQISEECNFRFRANEEPEEGEGEGESEGAAPGAAVGDGQAGGRLPVVTLTPTDVATITTVNEGREAMGLPPWPDEDGKLTIAEFKAKHGEVVADAAAAEDGVSPGDADAARTSEE